MLIEIPDKYFLVSGVGDASTPLNAFDCALLNSGVGNTNLVKMSSILPSGCKKIEPIKLPYGALVPVAYASKTSDVKSEMITAAVAVAIPEDDSLPGLIMEYSSKGHKEDIENIVIDMAKSGMAMRNSQIKNIYSTSIEHKVKRIGVAFAAVVLWK